MPVVTPRPRRAPDEGMTAIEAVVDVVVVGIVMSSMAALMLLSVKSFTPVKDVGNEPEQAAQRGLSRSAERMLADERCDNPSGGTIRSECLETARAPFPTPHTPPAWSGYPKAPGQTETTSDFTVCWMVEADDMTARPVGTAVPDPADPTKEYTYRNPDERDLECWYHDAAAGGAGRLLSAMHYPYENGSYGSTAQEQDSSDLFVPSWSAEPYRVSLVADRIGGMGLSGTGSNLKGWRCVEGADPNPGSQIGSIPVILPNRREARCDANIWDDASSPGVVVVSAKLCVLLSPDEFNRRRSLVRLDAARELQIESTACAGLPACEPAEGDTVEKCDTVDVMASPGRG